MKRLFLCTFTHHVHGYEDRAKTRLVWARSPDHAARIVLAEYGPDDVTDFDASAALGDPSPSSGG